MFESNILNEAVPGDETITGSLELYIHAEIYINIGTETKIFDTKITKQNLALIIMDEINKDDTTLEILFDNSNKKITINVNCTALT